MHLSGKRECIPPCLSLALHELTTTHHSTQVSRAERLRRHNLAWESQLPLLVEAFLEWRALGLRTEPPSVPPVAPGVSFLTVDMWSLTSKHTPPPYPLMHANVLIFSGRDRDFFIPMIAGSANESLLKQGFLSDAPLRPTYVYSLATLEHFRCLRNRKPSYSVQAFTRALSDIHLENWRSVYGRHFSEAYDVYLSILRGVDDLVASALKQDTPNYRVLHSCPPCHYKLAGEPELEHEFLLSIDGNNSLKRYASETSPWEPRFDSDYFIPPEEVNLLSKEVVHRAKKKPKKKKPDQDQPTEAPSSVTVPVVPPTTVAPSNAADLPPDGDEDVEMELDDATGETEPVEYTVMAGQIDAAGQIDGHLHVQDSLAEIVSVCVERWKANAEESKKGMFKCFEESGVFLGACHHGFILFVADMIMSGELCVLAFTRSS